MADIKPDEISATISVRPYSSITVFVNKNKLGLSVFKCTKRVLTVL